MSKHASEKDSDDFTFMHTDDDLVFDPDSAGPYMLQVRTCEGHELWYGPYGLADARRRARREEARLRQVAIHTTNSYRNYTIR